MAGAGPLELVRSLDFIEYLLFPKETENETPSSDSSDILASLCNVVRCIVAEQENNYIWNRDPFNITAKGNDSEIVKDSDVLPSHLYGITHFGDNIEDEWFIVYLLLLLTKELEGLVVRVTDNDGEFLLIEAADFLPEWANPDSCQQRVYLYNGEVHIIPLSLTSKDGNTTKSPKIKTAINMIRTQSATTRAAENIQEAIRNRIKGYPEKIKQDQHRATAYVPVAVAALLEKNPGLISHAVQAFCFRDPIDLKACRAMRYFPPENCVHTSILFTRPLYAMITHDKYVPDKRTGWPLAKNENDQKSFSLGVKVACGFEILVSQAKPPTVKTPPNEGESSNARSGEFIPDRGWYLYLESLKKKGYFSDLLEGSRDYNDKLKKAQEFYGKDRSQRFEPPVLTVGQQVASLLSTLEYDIDDLKNKEISAPDDEAWLEVNPGDLDKILEERYGKLGTKVGPSSNPAALSGALKDFLNHVSSLDGVEFPGSEDGAPLRPKRGVKKTKQNASTADSNKTDTDEMTSSTIDNKINFDSDAFASTVQSILDFVIPEDSWDMDSDSDGSTLGSFEDEADMDLDQMKPGTGNKNVPESEIKQFMDQMDRELASTTMGQSFEKAKTSTKKENEAHSSKQKEDDNFDSIEDFKPVDIDMNALKNILESYKSQFGEAGPASNLLGPMGIHLQNPEEDSDD